MLDKDSGTLMPICCSVCDAIPLEPNWHEEIGIDLFSRMCKSSKMEKNDIPESAGYPRALLDQYTASHTDLKDFVLSPRTTVHYPDESVVVCKTCAKDMKLNMNKSRRQRNHPPKDSIANGYLIGDAPKVLSDLNTVELSIVSGVRIYCQSWVFFAGCHQHIKGWHTFFKNRPASNVGNIEYLKISGLKGRILVVLCGPFTSSQKALTLKQTLVSPEKVVRAFQWLQENNIFYKNERVPEMSEIPVPQILEENV